jgi:hypothetical protein
VGQEEYGAFFKTTFREFLEPLAQAHFNVEGTIEFSALLFVPGMAPFEQQARLAAVPVPLCYCEYITRLLLKICSLVQHAPLSTRTLSRLCSCTLTPGAACAACCAACC